MIHNPHDFISIFYGTKLEVALEFYSNLSTATMGGTFGEDFAVNPSLEIGVCVKRVSNATLVSFGVTPGITGIIMQ